MEDYLGHLDQGPLDCLLSTQIADASRDTSVEDYLRFSKDEKWKQSLEELSDLLCKAQAGKALYPQAYREVMLSSIATWIHCTNRIEFAGCETEAETFSVIAGA